MDCTRLINVYRAMVTAREIDRIEQELTSRGEAFFHVSGAGHEAVAGLNCFLTPEDWLHCHYRDKALMIARGMSPRHFFDSLYCKHEAHARGRQMSAHLGDRSLKIVTMTGPVGNTALQAVGIAEAVRRHPSRPLVLCSVGDGTTQEGEFLEACAEAARRHLPVLFLIENNHWAISTPTKGQTFFDISGETPTHFHSIPIERVDGRSVPRVIGLFRRVVRDIRRLRAPRIVVLDVERLANHTNADDQSIYRCADDIARAWEHGDPIRRFERWLETRGVPRAELVSVHAAARAEVEAAEAASAAGPEPAPVFTASCQLPVELTHPSQEQRGDKDGGTLTMRDAMREVLRHQLQTDDRVTLYGEDIEDPKGDVFGVTKGLSTEFPSRVLNSPLSESTIVGTAVGRALAGQRPVAFLQFADFLPLAFNQIASEMGTIHWRSDGEWSAPVIVMVACGGYRPGLGPFHAQTFDSLIAHVPGVDVFVPSTASDAAGMLNAAFRSPRPTLFFYPKACLNDPAVGTTEDVASQFVPIGVSRQVRSGRDLTMVAWGNTVRICERAAAELEKAGLEAEIIDLRSLSPWDARAVITSAERTARLMVVHEDNHTCGFGAEVLATVAEKARVPVAMRRVTRSDTYVPCHFGNHIDVLPSFKRVLGVAAEMLDLELSWTAPEEAESGTEVIEAIGSGPSDETVIVAELLVRVGDTVRQGLPVASLEATKSVFELTSPVEGTICEVLAAEGATVAVGAPLFRVQTQEASRRPKPLTKEKPGTPVLSKHNCANRLRLPRHTMEPRRFDVGISSIATACGSRLVDNRELLIPLARDESQHRTASDIIKRTGIETRRWVGPGENSISMAVKACWELLDRERLVPSDIDVVICSTTSPTSVTPSVACQVLQELARGKEGTSAQAYDIHAACSGYLYACQAGYDYLQSEPNARVLIVTAEVLSPLLDPDDFDTVVLFGDAASATILYGEGHFGQASGRLLRPELSTKGDIDSALFVPLLNTGFIQMKGRRVFSEAVRAMMSSLNRVCSREGIEVKDLDLIVPHQANQRILDAIQDRVQPRVFSNIRHYGNTSSTSIPLCLSEILPTAQSGERLGLCAFGGGFTFGASIVQAI